MGNAARRRDEDLQSIIPRELQEVFEETDIEHTWNYLEATFRLNKKKWKELFEEQYNQSSRRYNKIELFVRFGKQYLEGPICTLLYRDTKYSNTWFSLLKFIVRTKMAEKQKEAGGRVYRR